MSVINAELLDWGIVVIEKHGPGRGSQLTPDERRQIQCLALVDGASVSEIARQTGRDRGTIANILRAEDSQTFRGQLETEAREAAVQILRGNAEKAARAWGAAIGYAADKGDHRPAKDLLLAVGAIHDQPATPGVVVVVGMPGRPAGDDPFEVVRVVSPGESDA